MIFKTTIMGNAGSDAELKESKSGTKFATVSVGTTEKWTDKEGKEQEKTTWVRLTVFGKSAESFAARIKKGMIVYAEGKIQASAYIKEDKAQASLEMTVETYRSFTTAPKN